MGYRTVALSSSSAKESLARELGAYDYIDGSKVSQVEALQKLGGAKLIVCTAPSANIIEELMNGLAHDGVLLLLGLVPELKVPGGAYASPNVITKDVGPVLR
jgi:D-arabinose 1-dehydrogenase-like Zn-dependent alcohol dehydrogenase